MTRIRPIFAALLLTLTSGGHAETRATGDLGLVIERADGGVKLIETSGNTILSTIEGLGDLSHASAVFSRDERFAYIFGRDGGLTKVDLLQGEIAKRVVQSGNSIGGWSPSPTTSPAGSASSTSTPSNRSPICPPSMATASSQRWSG